MNSDSIHKKISDEVVERYFEATKPMPKIVPMHDHTEYVGGKPKEVQKCAHCKLIISSGWYSISEGKEYHRACYERFVLGHVVAEICLTCGKRIREGKCECPPKLPRDDWKERFAEKVIELKEADYENGEPVDFGYRNMEGNRICTEVDWPHIEDFFAAVLASEIARERDRIRKALEEALLGKCRSDCRDADINECPKKEGYIRVTTCICICHSMISAALAATEPQDV